MYQKILIPVDGSEPSDHALGQGLALADLFGAEVVILTVVTPVPVVVNFDHTDELRQKLIQERREMLAAWEKRYPTERAKVRTDIAIGMPAEEICRRVGRESFDLVVIGSRGLSASERILLGSVSARVARCCSCPVLIIR